MHYYRPLKIPKKGQDSGKDSEHERNELERLSEKRSENEKSEKESENAGDEASGELEEDEGGEGLVALPDRVDQQKAEIRLEPIL
jgi:hypothetical protein